MKKTSDKDFRAFKKEFLRCVDLFGLKDYKLFFFLRDLEDETKIAHIVYESEACYARVYLNTILDDSDGNKDFDPVLNGRHEAIHLLFGRLFTLAEDRYASREAISTEEERIVRILEKLL